jgi:hypothetical protein
MTALPRQPNSQHQRLAAAREALDGAEINVHAHARIEAALLDYERILVTKRIEPEPVEAWFPAGALDDP